MNIAVGQVWKESDLRFERYIKVVAIESDVIRIITCSESGREQDGARAGGAMRARFGKSGGYRLVKEAS